MKIDLVRLATSPNHSEPKRVEAAYALPFFGFTDMSFYGLTLAANTAIQVVAVLVC